MSLNPARPRALATAAVLSIALATVAGSSRPAMAASVSPTVMRAVRGTPAEADIARGMDLLHRAKEQGVDRVPRQFALDLAKYPREGVAHRNVLVVLAKFPSEGGAPAQGPASASTPFYYQRRFFNDDPNDGLISMREYYAENSKGRLVISGRVTSGWLSMPHSYDYYAAGQSGLGSYPHNAQGLAEDALRAAYGDFESDLSYFDNDGPDGVPASGDDDGYIDAVIVIAPGQGGEVSSTCCNRLWAHQFTLAIYSDCPTGSNAGPGCLPGMQLGSVRGYVYVLASEYNEFPGDNAVGTYFHEFGHTLGLPDLYDPDPNRGGLGFYSLMSLGNYLPFDDVNGYTAGGTLGSRPGNLDAWCRQHLGFDEPVTPSVAGSWSLPPVTRGGGSLRLWTDGEPGSEYFLIENRIREGSDAFIPGEGLLIYHIDDTEVDNLGGPANYRVTLVEADGQSDMTTSPNYGEPMDFFPGPLQNRTLTQSTSPNSRSFAGLDTGIRITNMVGAVDNADTASFDLVLSTQTELRLEGFTVDDGGGDGQPDPNESIQLTVTIRNTGLQSGPVHLTLSTADPAVSMTQALVVGNAMGPGSTQTMNQAFAFSIGSIATLPHEIAFTVTWTEDGGGTGAFALPLTVGIASGLSEDFESGAEPGLFWTHAPVSSGPDQWHSSASRASSGTRSAKLGSTLPLGSGSTNESETYATSQDAALISPVFDLPPGSELVFQSWIDAETNGGTGCWDGGRVELSLNGGEWFPLDVDGGYNYLVEHNSGATLRGMLVFSGSPQRWQRVTADLSPYSGSARVRFRFSSDGADEPTDQFGRLVRRYEGWYVDDVLIQPRTATGPTPRKLSLRAGPSPYWAGGPSAGNVTVRFSAKDGLPHPELSPEVRVFDVRGRLVKTMIAKPTALVASEFRATWDGRGRNGEPVRSGMYFIQVDIQGVSESFRLIVLR